MSMAASIRETESLLMIIREAWRIMESHIPYRTDLLSLKKRRIRVVKAAVPCTDKWYLPSFCG